MEIFMNFYKFENVWHVVCYLLIKILTITILAGFSMFLSPSPNVVFHYLAGILLLFAVGMMGSIIFWDLKNPTIKPYFLKG